MASIHKEITIDARPEDVWDALRDVGALHTRLVPGFVVDTRLEDGARIVTFGNGTVARELIVDLDDDSRRLAWSVVGGRFTHHNASAQVSPTASIAADSSGSPTCCRTSWPATSPASWSRAPRSSRRRLSAADSRDSDRHTAAECTIRGDSFGGGRRSPDTPAVVVTPGPFRANSS